MGRSSIRLGRFFGIPVGLDWSLLVIAGLLTFSLAADRFPAEFPGEATGAYWVVGIVAAGLFFASVLAHELAHSLVARRHGVQVEGITLWMLGGMARLGGESPSRARRVPDRRGGPGHERGPRGPVRRGRVHAVSARCSRAACCRRWHGSRSSTRSWRSSISSRPRRSTVAASSRPSCGSSAATGTGRPRRPRKSASCSAGCSSAPAPSAGSPASASAVCGRR